VDRHKDLITLLLCLPFVAFVPTLFPRPEYSFGQSALAFLYLMAGAAVARLMAIGLARAWVKRRPPPDDDH
jgi:hypothetical protein